MLRASATSSLAGPRSISEDLAQPRARLAEGGALLIACGGGAEQGFGCPGCLPFPDDAGHAEMWDRLEVKGERGRRAAKVAFGRGEDAPLRVLGVLRQEEPAAGGADDADAAATTVERVGAGCLVQVPHDDDGSAGAIAERFQGSESATDILITIGIVATLQVGHEGIDDDEGGVGADDEGFQEQDMAGDGEGPPEWGAARDGQERDDASRVTASAIDARANRIVEIVLGGEDDDVARSGGLPAGQSLTAGDAGGELAQESALAEAGIAVEDGDLAGGETAGREPLGPC